MSMGGLEACDPSWGRAALGWNRDSLPNRHGRGERRARLVEKPLLRPFDVLEIGPADSDREAPPVIAEAQEALANLFREALRKRGRAALAGLDRNNRETQTVEPSRPVLRSNAAN